MAAAGAGGERNDVDAAPGQLRDIELSVDGDQGVREEILPVPVPAVKVGSGRFGGRIDDAALGVDGAEKQDDAGRLEEPRVHILQRNRHLRLPPRSTLIASDA